MENAEAMDPPREGLIGQGHQVFNRPYLVEALAVGRRKPVANAAVDTSGARVLSHLGLNEKTVWFINEHAHVARGATNTEPVTCITATQGVPAQNKHLNTHVSLITGNPKHNSQPVVVPDVNMTNTLDGLRDATMMRGLDQLAGQNANQGSDGEISSVSSFRRKKGVKSGMLAKPTDNIKTVETWPHYNLHYEYASKPIEFNDINFEQYIAGETRTILACEDVLEIKGRLNLMFRLAHLKQRGHGWENLQSLYAAVVRSIEMHESNWSSDWRMIEEMVIDALDRKPVGKGAKKKGQEVWFCREFN